MSGLRKYNTRDWITRSPLTNIELAHEIRSVSGTRVKVVTDINAVHKGWPAGEVIRKQTQRGK